MSEQNLMEARNGTQIHVMFDQETGLWTSPNSCSLLKPIPMQEEPPLSAFYRQCRQPRWLFERYPFLAFWPLQVRWEGPIFERLNIPPSWDGVQKTIVHTLPHRFVMKSDLMERWKRLEWALQAVNFHLMRALGLTRHADLGHIMLPVECGYTGTHRTHEFARMAAFRSRDAFIALTTFLSFAIALHIAREPIGRQQPDGSVPQWVKVLQDQNIHPVWIDDLRKSFVCDFMPSFRPGAYVKAEVTKCGPLFEAFRVANVPLWISWGFQPPPSMEDLQGMLRYRPTQREVTLASQRVSRSDSNAPSTSHPAPGSGSLATPGIPAPKPERGSLQRDGEAPEVFRARMASERLQYLASLSQADLAGLGSSHELAMAQTHDTELEMPSVGTSMYQWVFYPGGHFRRELVSKRRWKDEWQRRSPEARYFYDFLEQWDLDLAEDISDDEGDQDDDSAGEGEGLIMPPPELDPSLVHVAALTKDDVHDRYGYDLGSTDQVEALNPIHLFGVRYGFSVHLPYQHDPRITVPTAGNEGLTDKPMSALERLGLKAHEGTGVETAALDLYNFAISHAKTPVAFPPSFEGFRPSGCSIVLDHPRLAYRRVKANAHLVGIKGKPLDQQWYLLAVRNPVDICQLFRENIESVLAMARYLLSCGIPFATVRCLPLTPAARREPRPRLGFRRQGHVFDAADYNAYEEAKNDRLKSSVGRAALMRGGIVWRLAKDVVPVKSVTKGPSPGIKEDGYVWDTMDDFRLVDDSLSLRDEDVICGMYYVETKPNQYEQRSWWPQSNTWETCGYNLGYWTPDCETWYRKRWEEIRGGEAELHNATKWRSLLRRRAGLTKKFRDGIDVLSDSFLQGRSSYWREG
ncbi:hypothetical protein JOM56_014631 [Amanita muscaria]